MAYTHVQMHGFDLPPGPLGPHSTGLGMMGADADHMMQQGALSLQSSAQTAQHHHLHHHNQPHQRHSIDSRHYQHSDGSSSGRGSSSNMSHQLHKHDQPECGDSFVTYPDSEDDDSMPAGSP